MTKEVPNVGITILFVMAKEVINIEIMIRFMITQRLMGGLNIDDVKGKNSAKTPRRIFQNIFG